MKINTFSLIFILFASSFSLGAIAETATSTTTGTVSTSTDLTAAQKEDAQIINILRVINTNEINAGNEALKRTTNPAVRNFAQTMVTDHSENLRKVKTFSQKMNMLPLSSKKSTYLQNKGQEELQTLSTVSSATFDKTYIDAMVKGHEAALTVINKKLLPDVTNPQLKVLLTATAAKVSAHLTMAQAIQSQLTKTS